ncbi:conjugal transfer protein TraF [Novosphingobium sp. MD-1]|uniref:conjugal transfer protein TraF n=1 Tax=Novosphingobium sp. MD-1 TaxID=1630648 RepID=UPI00061C0308|nr:conjugal transfer protein TraF [Novosphingobium sp. MD-1]GAO52961.1 incF plasmid conjugative transfer pilus assembly protein traF [Novosphingobium sp. MD-1]
MRRIMITVMLASGLLSASVLQAQDKTAGDDGADSVATAAAQDPASSAAGAAGPGSEDVTGDAFYCHERKLGTWFYCDRRKRPAPDRAAPPASTRSATAQLAAITQRLDELKARAVLEPTEANVTAYIRYQREQLDRASLFSDVWQRAVWQDPTLDYTLQRPVSTLGKRAWLDNRKADEEATLRRLSQRYGIFYFYAQSCGACEVFAPILKAVSDKGGFDVVAVSMDGGPNRTFPRYVVDTGQYARMGLTSRATPALVLYDTVTKRPVPIGTGILSADEITERIFVLTNTKPGSGF